MTWLNNLFILIRNNKSYIRIMQNPGFYFTPPTPNLQSSQAPSALLRTPQVEDKHCEDRCKPITLVSCLWVCQGGPTSSALCLEPVPASLGTDILKHYFKTLYNSTTTTHPRGHLGGLSEMAGMEFLGTETKGVQSTACLLPSYLVSTYDCLYR